MCNMDCFTCSYKDCKYNGVTDAERKVQNVYDRYCMKERIPEERKQKGRTLTQYDYNHSDKGRAARKKYEQSEKGKAAAKRKATKAIASGKNAEACKRYYYRKKAEREAV